MIITTDLRGLEAYPAHMTSVNFTSNEHPQPTASGFFKNGLKKSLAETH